ncbi:nuclear-pore anchor, partial [Trifolium medium]|nr:nuclear-pore anchor [Trifolium medium]
TTLIAIREVEAVKQELLEEREHVKRVKENFIRDVTVAESRAIFAEAKFSDLQRKIKLTDYKVS